MKKAFLIASFMFVCSLSASVNRQTNNIGLYFGAYDPIPGSAGINLGWNITPFLRISGGISGYSNGEGGVFDSFGDSLMSGVLYIALLGMVDYDDIRDFVEMDEGTSRYIFSYGAGINLFVPGWNLSPTVGVQLGNCLSHNHPFGLRDKQSFVSYRAGLEWQSEIGLMLGIGFAYSPALSSEFREKYYAQLGWLF